MADRPLLALLDGYSLAYRAFFALPDDLRTSTGQLTNAVYGFTSMLIKLLDEHRPDGIAVVFDRGRPVERMELMPDYKANRAETPDDFRAQVPLIDQVLEALAIPSVGVDGQEADDVIATYARHAGAAGMDTLIVTGDRDSFQLVDDTTRILYTRRGISDTVVMDHDAVVDKYGVEPARYPMLAALRGDPSDNIPGVPGVGDKTATKLLVDFGDLEGVYANLDKVRGTKVPAALAEHRDSVMVGFEVVTLRRDLELPAPIEELVMGAVDLERVRQTFTALEFRSLWERLNETVLAGAADAGQRALEAEPRRVAEGELAEWVDALDPGALVAVLCDLDGRPPRADVRGVALAADGHDPVWVAPRDLVAADREVLAGLIADADRPLATHDAKALAHAGDVLGWQVAGIRIDTELAAYLVNPGARGYDLAQLALAHLGASLGDAVAADSGDQLALDVDDGAWRDLALRAQAVAELADPLSQAMAERDQTELHDTMELPLTRVLAGMEHVGIAVDRSVLDELGATLGARIEALRTEIWSHADGEFNLDSPKQLQDVLFTRLGLPKTKRIKTGYTTDASALGALVDVHPIIAPLLEYRETSKLKGTYVDALPRLIDPRTGRIHARFHQTVASTGRLSSSEPNMQNIPIRTEAGRVIRRAFVPGEGATSLLVADYSQIELRVIAHLSEDEGLVAAFTSGEDIHAQTAAMVWDLPLDAIDTTLRSRIKGMTYGLAYGLSAFGLSQQLGIPPDEARELMDAYFERFPGVRDYLRGTVEEARRTGWTGTLFGRRRYLPDLVSDNRQRREMAERAALNAPIQGTAADIFKLSMLAVADEMERRDMRSRVLLQVHDELVCETAPGEEDDLRDLLVTQMAGVADLRVQLEVDTASGLSWYDAEKH